MTDGLTSTTARAGFAAWMAYQPERDNYRIVHPDSSAVAVYDRMTGDRWWTTRTMDEVIELPEITPAVTAWQEASAAIVATTRATGSAA
jgi:hypothetical protein